MLFYFILAWHLYFLTDSRDSVVVEEDEDDDDEDATVDAASSDVAAAKTHCPSSVAKAKWASLLDFQTKSTSKKSYGPAISKTLKFWNDNNEAVGFRAPKEDPCVRFAFDNAKVKNKSVFDLSSASASVAGALANAIFRALEEVECFVDFFKKKASDGEPLSWTPEECAEAAAVVTKFIKTPLEDAGRMQAHAFGKAISAVRNAVVSSADSRLKSALKDFPPSDEFFFGNPHEQLHQYISIEMDLARAKPSASSSSVRGRGFLASRRAAPSSAASSFKSTDASKSPASSSASAAPWKRPASKGFRGAKGGKRGK